MGRAGSFAQSSDSPRKTINGCEKVGECGMRNLGLDELIIRQLHRSKMEPCEGTTALGSIVFLQTGCQLQGLLSVIEGMSCFPDFSSLASVICLFANSSMESSVELFIKSPPLSVRRNTWTWLNIQLLTESLQAGFMPSVTQRKAKQNHTWIRLLQRRGGKREIWAAAMPELRPVFMGQCGWWCPRGCSSHGLTTALVPLYESPQRFFIVGPFIVGFLLEVHNLFRELFSSIIQHEPVQSCSSHWYSFMFHFSSE